MELQATQEEAGATSSGAGRSRRNGPFSGSGSDEDGPSDDEGEEQAVAAGGLDEDDEEEGDELGGAPRSRPEAGKKRDRCGTSFAGAAFGFGTTRRRSNEADSESGSQSQTSSTRRHDLERRVFPVPGLRCVLCSLAHRIAPVETFVDENATRLETSALFKFAQVVYREKIKAPLEAEGASVPDVSYEMMVNHFRLHCAHPRLQRAEKVKTLTAVREKIAERLVRYEEDGSGTGEVDKASFELWLKAAAFESRERSLLFASSSGGGGKKAAAAPGQPQMEE